MINRLVLYQEYIIHEKSLRQIAKEYNLSHVHVYRLCIKYNIPLRNKKEACIISIENGRHKNQYQVTDILKENEKEIIYDEE